MGSGEYAVTKLSNLFAIPAPHRQKRVGSVVLCIPLVHGVYPWLIHCCAFSHVNPTWWSVFCQCVGHVTDVCPSSTSNPHDPHTFQFACFFVTFDWKGAFTLAPVIGVTCPGPLINGGILPIAAVV
jgi:hypothetical protein